MDKGSAILNYIAEVMSNPSNINSYFCNGDIDSPEKAKEYKEKYGVDGIMIGRAAIGNPWIFNQIKTFLDTGEKMEKPSLKREDKYSKKTPKLFNRMERREIRTS